MQLTIPSPASAQVMQLPIALGAVVAFIADPSGLHPSRINYELGGCLAGGLVPGVSNLSPF